MIKEQFQQSRLSATDGMNLNATPVRFQSHNFTNDLEVIKNTIYIFYVIKCDGQQ